MLHECADGIVLWCGEQGPEAEQHQCDVDSRVKEGASFDHLNTNTRVFLKSEKVDLIGQNVRRQDIFARYPHAQLARLRVEETVNNSFDCVHPAAGPAARTL